MNIIFLGSSRFSLPALSGILSSPYRIICVVTQPDRPAGRGMSLISTPVKKLCLELNLPLHQTEDVNSKESLGFLKGLQPDLLCVVAFGQILSETVLGIPKVFSVNLHASLLPKYRGAAPIRQAIINNEANTGLTVIKMVKNLDAGPIILQKEIEIIDSDDAISLDDKLSHLGSPLLIQALDLIKTNRYSLVNQDERLVSFAPKLKKHDGLIYWNKSARDVFNLVRGCLNWPGAFTYFRQKVLKIHKASILSDYPTAAIADSIPGKVIAILKKGIIVLTGNGSLLIEEIQIEGKRRISAEEFISGYRISVGEMLGEKK